jgi:trk system potassium uptake protein TrkH
LVKYPARVSFAWYLSLILAGGLILHLPACRRAAAEPIRLIDAIFTSTSACCVTGLATRSTGNDFSFVGQLVILALIQLGGVGIITVTTFAMVQLGAQSSLRQRQVMVESLGMSDRADLRKILGRVLFSTLLFEGVGALILAIRFAFDMPLGQAVWAGTFHSVSAFCNAGFGLWDDSLVRYQTDVVINLVIPLLIIVGGIGFPVILDLRRHRHRPWRELWDRLNVHSKLMLVGTAVLLAFGAISFLLLEWDGVLGKLTWWQRPLVAMFHSATTRTAGFNSVELRQLSTATLFITILLMMVGAGPCSSAGGFKVSTLSVLVLYAWTRFRGGSRVSVFRRTIPAETTGKAIVVAMIFFVMTALSLVAMLIVEQAAMSNFRAQNEFLDAAFEVASALGTVGLSMGITPQLSDAGKIVIMALMFMGRLGPISVFVAMSSFERKNTVEYASVEPLLG